MSNRLIKASVILTLFLTLCIVIAARHDNPAFAKNQEGNAKAKAASVMAKYSLKNKQTSTAPIRKSRLTQINFVSEAAQALNVLPIVIIQEMEKGKTILQIAQDKGYTKAEFVQKLTDIESTTIKAADASGAISKKHANALKQGMADRINNNLNMKAANVMDHQPMNMNN